MALGLQTESGGGGDFAEIVKFDSRAGRMFRLDRAQDAGGAWQTNNVEITNDFQAVMDLENIQVGWALFAAGMAPSFALVPLGQALPNKPSADHKQAFKIIMKLGKSCGGDVREMVSQSKAVIGSVDALHTQYEAGRLENPGKLPIVALKGSTAVVSSGKGQTSTNYQPIWEIVKWVDRPAELNGVEAKAQVASEPLPKTEPVKAAEPAKTLANVDDEF